MIKSIITTILLSFSCAVFAQNVEFKAANFKDDKDGLKAATDAIKKGDEYFTIANEAIFLVQSPGLNYELALKNYQIAQKFNPKNAEVNFKIGVCYINSTYSSKGVPHIFEAYKLDPTCDNFMEYYYAKALQLDNKFMDAIKAYDAF